MAKRARARRPAGLTARQQRFCLEYVKDLNATQAAIRAGYSARTAHVQGPRLLENVWVRPRLAELQAETAKRVGLEAEEILRGFQRVAHADLRQVMRTDPASGETRLLPVQQWPDDLALAIGGVKVRHHTSKDGGPYEVLQITLESRTAALTKLGQHLGLFREQAPSETGQYGVLRVPMPISKDDYFTALQKHQASLPGKQ